MALADAGVPLAGVHVKLWVDVTDPRCPPTNQPGAQAVTIWVDGAEFLATPNPPKFRATRITHLHDF